MENKTDATQPVGVQATFVMQVEVSLTDEQVRCLLFRSQKQGMSAAAYLSEWIVTACRASKSELKEYREFIAKQTETVLE